MQKLWSMTTTRVLVEGGGGMGSGDLDDIGCLFEIQGFGGFETLVNKSC